MNEQKNNTTVFIIENDLNEIFYLWGAYVGDNLVTLGEREICVLLGGFQFSYALKKTNPINSRCLKDNIRGKNTFSSCNRICRKWGHMLPFVSFCLFRDSSKLNKVLLQWRQTVRNALSLFKTSSLLLYVICSAHGPSTCMNVVCYSNSLFRWFTFNWECQPGCVRWALIIHQWPVL